VHEWHKEYENFERTLIGMTLHIHRTSSQSQNHVMSLQQQIQNESKQLQALFGRLFNTQSSEAALSEARSYLISC